jgi:hypothetical protein
MPYLSKRQEEEICLNLYQFESFLPWGGTIFVCAEVDKNIRGAVIDHRP